LTKIIELALLLQTVQRDEWFWFEHKMHALMPAILLWMTGLDAFGGNAQTPSLERLNRELGEVEFVAGLTLSTISI